MVSGLQCAVFDCVVESVKCFANDSASSLPALSSTDTAAGTARSAIRRKCEPRPRHWQRSPGAGSECEGKSVTVQRQEAAQRRFGAQALDGDTCALDHCGASTVAQREVTPHALGATPGTHATSRAHAQSGEGGTNAVRARQRAKSGHRPHRCLQLKESSFPATKRMAFRRRAR